MPYREWFSAGFVLAFERTESETFPPLGPIRQRVASQGFRRVKIVIIIVIVLLVVLTAGGVLLAPTIMKQMESWSSAPQGLAVRMDAVEEREIVETIPAPGEVEPHTKVEISAQVVGEIIDLPFREGEEVKKGDLVVKIDDRDLQAALLGAQAALESSKANFESTQASRDRAKSQLQEQTNRHEGLKSTLNFAKRSLERKQQLFDSGDISESELDLALERVREIEAQIDASISMISAAENSIASAEAQVRQAQAAIKQAEADIGRTEEQIRNTTIYSPIDGRVTRLNAEIGETVITGTMNNAGTVIMTIADLSRMRMVARVAESDVTKVQPGQTANIFIIGHGEEPFRGVVSRIALQRTMANDGTGFFETEVDLRLDGREVRSGHTANVEIEIGKHQGLVVPSQCVVDRVLDELPVSVVQQSVAADSTKRAVRVVYRVVDGKTVVTPVEVGPSDQSHTLVVAGLNAGDMVVSGPYKALDTLKHDTAVRDLTKDEAATAQTNVVADRSSSSSS